MYSSLDICALQRTTILENYLEIVTSFGHKDQLCDASFQSNYQLVWTHCLLHEQCDLDLRDMGKGNDIPFDHGQHIQI